MPSIGVREILAGRVRPGRFHRGAIVRMKVHMPTVAPYAEFVCGSIAVYFLPPAFWYSRLHISA